jgi:hypothetical protein
MFDSSRHVANRMSCGQGRRNRRNWRGCGRPGVRPPPAAASPAGHYRRGRGTDRPAGTMFDSSRHVANRMSCGQGRRSVQLAGVRAAWRATASGRGLTGRPLPPQPGCRPSGRYERSTVLATWRIVCRAGKGANRCNWQGVRAAWYTTASRTRRKSWRSEDSALDFERSYFFFISWASRTRASSSFFVTLAISSGSESDAAPV